jgi:hypothetical protein
MSKYVEQREKVAQWLERNGWRQGGRMYGNPDKARCLIEGADAALSYRHPGYCDFVLGELREELFALGVREQRDPNGGERSASSPISVSLACWNDDPDRTVEHVLKLIRGTLTSEDLGLA